ncbi:MAG: type II toxin-antitoxin system HicB family antitoxin [Thermosynechococcaceae cyanobacterium]
MTDAKLYLYRTCWSQEDQEFVGLCAEFPSLSYLDPDPAHALTGIMEVVEFCLEDLAAQGDPIPEPLALKKFSGRFQVRIPAEQHRQLAIEAAEQEISLNRLVSSRLMSQATRK